MRRRGALLILRAASLAVLAAAIVLGCTAPASSSPASDAPSASPISAASPSAVATATLPMPSAVAASLNPSCSKGSDPALRGVVEERPEGWFYQLDTEPPGGYPDTVGQVYGPEGTEVPPEEGPGRLTLYETFENDTGYLDFRVEQAQDGGSQSTAATVCGQPAEVWIDESTGELLLGWTDRNKVAVLIANTADFTVEELVAAAESVSDCCG